MAGFRPKAGERNIPSTPIPTKTCKKCSRSWTEDHFRDKRGAPTQLCLQCRDASNKSHKRRRERESLKAKIAREARVEQEYAMAPPLHHPPSVTREAVPEFQSSGQDTPSRILNQDLLNDRYQNMAPQPGARSGFAQPAPSYTEIQTPGPGNLRVSPPAPPVPPGTNEEDYTEIMAQFARPASRDHGADMPKLDPQSQRPLLNFEIQSMTVSVESSAGTTRTSSETPDDSALALIAREGEPVSININLVCRFARRTRE
ncbi:hypothetical protein BDW60DRAFT_207889 [Aspergillus nidulans var. acristatus]